MFAWLQTLPLPAQVVFFALSGLVQSVLLVGLAAGLARLGRARTLNRWRLRPGQVRDERIGLLLTVASDGLVLGLVSAAGLLPATPFVPADAAVTFVALFAWFELAFYAVHRAMHGRLLFRFHVRHHRSTVPTAWSSVNFHPVERLGIQLAYLAFPLLFASFIPFSRQGMAAYYLFNLALNAVHHGNVEWVPRWVRRLPLVGVIVAPCAQHVVHHAGGRGNYGLFTSLPDRLLGTYLPQTEGWYARAVGEAHGAQGARLGPGLVRAGR